MRVADRPDHYLVCRVCGAGIHANIHFRDDIPRLAPGSLQTCPRGCTLDMLQAKLEAEFRGRMEAMKVKPPPRPRGCRNSVFAARAAEIRRRRRGAHK